MTALLFIATVGLSALFSGLETGIYTTSRLRLFLDAQRGVGAARRARELLHDMPSLLAVLLVANNLANWGASFSAQVLLRDAGVAHSTLVGTGLVSIVLLLCSESAPKSAFRRGRERLLYPTIPVLWVLHRTLAPLLVPISWFAVQLSRVVRRRVEGGHESAGRGETVLDTGAAEGFLTPFQKRVAGGVLAMRTRTAAQEALPLDRFPTVRLPPEGDGAPGPGDGGTAPRSPPVLPQGSHEHRVLVLDAEGQRILGWMPLAALWQPDGFRAPRRSEVRPVSRVDGATSLDRVYVGLDRLRAPFAVLPDLRVLDANLLRQAVMGTFGREGGAA